MAFLLDRFESPLSVFEDLLDLQDNFNRAISGSGMGGAWQYPPVKVWASQDETVLDMDLPGLDPKTVELSVDGDVLSVKGRRDPQDADKTYHTRERFAGSFARNLQLPYRAQADKIKATYRNGLLRVQAPRAEADRPKKVNVEVR